MLSQRMSDLFRLLQCTNSDIARFAGCSPSNVSRLRSGVREPRQDSRAVWRLAQGIYRYADDENLLPLLCQLCGVEDARPEALIPAVVTWLYQDQPYQLPQRIQPKSKREEADRLQSFGARLDQTMTLLEYTNGKLAADLNVDASLVSRYRAGIYHPNRNATIRNRLVELLLARAERLGRLAALAALCGVRAEALTSEAAFFRNRRIHPAIHRCLHAQAGDACRIAANAGYSVLRTLLGHAGAAQRRGAFSERSGPGWRGAATLF